MLPPGGGDLDLGSSLSTGGAGAQGLGPSSVWESSAFYRWCPEKGWKEPGVWNFTAVASGIHPGAHTCASGNQNLVGWDSGIQ